MPGNPPSYPSEQQNLLAYLTQQRDGLKNAAYGLTEEQIRLKPTASALSIGGLIKHGAHTEASWRDTLLQVAGDEDGVGAYVDSFTLTADDTLSSLVSALEDGGRATAKAVRGLADLGAEVPLPPAPWYPPDLRTVSARWILVHLIEELARHAGHADIIREHIDGATMYELMAGAEGWPETEWLKPWKPPEAG